MNRTVLIMEDDLATSEILAIIAGQLNLSVVTSPEILRIDEIIAIDPVLVITDHWLNGKLGSAICKEIKRHFLTDRIPIIMISAVRDIEPIAKECGANAFLSKPFNLEDLMQLMRRFVMSPI